MIAIMSAMQEEVQALLQNIKNVTPVTKGMRTYYKGVLFNKPVVIVFSRWGKVAAAATATQLINDFKAQKFKYIVSVGTLTTGFDSPHVDTIAVLRATESASLFQQIIGRGLRLCDGKSDCLVLDYASNIERHELEGDLFTPKITAYRAKESVSI